MKQKSPFLKPRHERFTIALKAAMKELHAKLFIQGKKSEIGGWKFPATRTRVRQLAREMARSKMRDEARAVGTLERI